MPSEPTSPNLPADASPAATSMPLTVDPASVEEASVLPQRALDQHADAEHEEENADTDSRLPAEPDLPPVTSVPAQPSGAEKKVRGRILVMESDVEVANLIVSALEDADYEMELAMDAKYGLILADTFNPELILLDVELPGLSGGDMKQILRAAPNFAGRFVDIPILYLGEHDHMVKQRFHSSPETPMSRYIMKPIDYQELRDKVARAFAELQQKRAAQED